MVVDGYRLQCGFDFWLKGLTQLGGGICFEVLGCGALTPGEDFYGIQETHIGDGVGKNGKGF